MPRRFRQFTAEDVKRFYCRNLSPADRALFDQLDCDWSDLTDLEKVIRILDVVNSPPFSYIFDMLPLGGVVTIMLDWITLLLVSERDALPAPEPPLLPWA